MGAHSPLERDAARTATDRVLSYLERAKRDGRYVFPLVDVAHETALDPNTAEAVMTELEREGPLAVTRLEGEYGERRWRVRG